MDKSPDAFRTISEAADELDLPQHVLRFWETRFSTIKPLKRGGGRRYYRPEDVLLLKGIRHLLYDQGFTIKGVQKILKDQGARHVVALASGGSLEALPPPSSYEESDEPAVEEMNGEAAGEVTPRSAVALNGSARERLNEVLKELLECKRLLERARE
ncbi:MAG: MerR family transcriptional regulator [Hyphomicrobiales bacterium]|nr:MAG: MerR family transcriptional regulator [Hyphomicrobiales bacterium]